MSEPYGISRASLPLSALERIERICTRFEDEWKEGREPSIESYLGAGADWEIRPTDACPAPERLALLRELLMLDLSYRRRRGQQPSQHEYLQRFPGHEELIRAVFAEVVSLDPKATEALSPQQLEGDRRQQPAPAGKPELPMSPAVADRNLLFGILALQMDFIARDQLSRPIPPATRARTRPYSRSSARNRRPSSPPVAEECRRLLDRLGDAELLSVAVWKMEGYTNEEIAVKLDRDVRTVERRLRLIRKTWSQEDAP